MFVEMMTHLLALDLAYFFRLIFFNLDWLFLFFLTIYIFTGGQAVVKGFFLLILNLFALLDFLDILQLIIFTSTGLLLFYLVKFFVLTFVENSDKMKKHLIVFNEASAFGTIILFNLGVFALLGIGV